MDEIAPEGLDNFRDISFECWHEFAECVERCGIVSPYIGEARSLRKSLESLFGWGRRCEKLLQSWDRCQSEMIPRLIAANSTSLGCEVQGLYSFNLAHQAARVRLEWLVDAVFEHQGLTADTSLMWNPSTWWDFERSIDIENDTQWLKTVRKFCESQDKRSDIYSQIEREHAIATHKSPESTISNHWSKPRSPSEWCKILEISLKTFERRRKDATYRSKKITSKSICIDMRDLPESFTD